MACLISSRHALRKKSSNPSGAARSALSAKTPLRSVRQRCFSYPLNYVSPGQGPNVRSPAGIFPRMALDHPEYVPKSARLIEFFLVAVTKWCPVLGRGSTVAMTEAKPGAAVAHDPWTTGYEPSAGTDTRDCIYSPRRDEGVTPSTAWPRTGRSVHPRANQASSGDLPNGCRFAVNMAVGARIVMGCRAAARPPPS